MRYFKEQELCCKCCGQLPPFARENIEALVEDVLDPLRERYGKPIVVNSGYRCAKHNKEVGGVANSQHLRGEAADIRPADPNDLKLLRQLIMESRKLTSSTSDATQDSSNKPGSPSLLPKFDQQIIYPTFIHVSWKRSGNNRRTVLWH